MYTVSVNSKKRRDQKKKTQKKPSHKNTAGLPDFDQLSSKKAFDPFDPARLTTPKNIDQNITEFCKKHCGNVPFYINVKPELWSRQSCCDLNVKEYIKHNGGEIICGFKIWYNEPHYIEAERHAVWLKDGEYLDVTFNADGEDKILFVVDKPEFTKSLDSNDVKFRWGGTQRVKNIIMIQELAEQRSNFIKMSDEECWDTMLTYEQWLNGKRMSSINPMPL